MAKPHKINKQMLKKRILPTLLISSLLPFILCVSVPIDLFANNYSEFYFSIADFLPFCIMLLFCSMLIIFFILFFLPNLAYRIVSSLIISISLMFFIQSSFLNGSLNSLNGDNIGGTSISMTTKVINIIIWTTIIVLAVVLSCLKDKKGILSMVSVVVSVALLAAHLITPISTAISNREAFLSRLDRIKEDDDSANHYILTTKNLDKVYTESNIYYFVVDRFDEGFAETIENKIPGVYDNLTGFTWFQDNISLYGHTYPAIANMLTGKDLDTAKTRTEYLNEVAYSGDNPLKELYDNGYEINIYTQEYYAFTDAYYLPEYVENRAESDSYKISNHFLQSMSIIGMGFYRAAPFFIKDLFYLDSVALNEYAIEYDEDGNVRYSNSNSSVKKLTEDELSTIQGKGFHFIHLDGLHSWNLNSMYNKSISKISFNFIDKYIDFLKENDLYEEATIIIAGDHGKSAGDRGDMSDARQTALFVKPSGASEGALKKSKAQTSHENIWATIMSSAKIETETAYGKSVFDITEEETTTRRFFWHTYYNPLVCYEYQITGSGDNFDNWKKVKETKFEGRSLLS